MRVFNSFLAFCAGVVTLVLYGCGAASKDNPMPPTVEVKTTSVQAEGYSQYIYVKASSSWKITFSSESGEVLDWIIAEPSVGDGNKSVTLRVAANESEDERVAILTASTSGGTATVTISQKAKKSEPKPDPKPSGGNLPPKTGWLELPAIPEGTDAFTHPMTVGSTKTRNYSFIWDYGNLVAPWVAYPLCKWNIGGPLKRTNAWALDPLLPESRQPVLSYSYGGDNKYHEKNNPSGYVRGHQIPSADRLTSYESNSMTFYGTNMTPQIHSGFNEDIWANLEGKVRSWASSSDTLYVVTGCVIDYKDGETVKYALDNNGKKVTVPTAYYKVVLRYMKNSTIGYSGYSACAVWLDHKVYSSKNINSSYSMSVDDLEKKTGIDFFVNLPAKVGEDVAAKVEAENPADISWWWR